jgi:hypothetical protein
VIDLRTAVHNFWDRGMLGMVLHPNYPGIPYVYVMYAYDAIPGGAAPRWGTAAVWSEWFAGLVDEVRIYNRALTQGEIQAGMSQTLGGA